MATGSTRLRPVFLLTAVLALSLGGMPLTSGALAKLAAKPMLGYGALSIAVSLAGAGSTLLMLHFLRVVRSDASSDISARAPMAETVPWLAVTAASLILPWSLYPAISGESVSDQFSAEALWKLLWPVALGAFAMLGLSRVTALQGAIPEGDILHALRRGTPLLRGFLMRIGEVDAVLRRWPVGSLLLIALVVLLGVALHAKG